MYRFSGRSVCTDFLSDLYEQILCQICMYRFSVRSVCTDSLSDLFVQILCQICMYRFSVWSVCTDSLSDLYVQILYQIHIKRFIIRSTLKDSSADLSFISISTFAMARLRVNTSPYFGNLLITGLLDLSSDLLLFIYYLKWQLFHKCTLRFGQKQVLFSPIQ